jgi:hypothetical protein
MDRRGKSSARACRADGFDPLVEFEREDASQSMQWLEIRLFE